MKETMSLLHSEVENQSTKAFRVVYSLCCYWYLLCHIEGRQYLSIGLDDPRRFQSGRSY